VVAGDSIDLAEVEGDSAGAVGLEFGVGEATGEPAVGAGDDDDVFLFAGDGAEVGGVVLAGDGPVAAEGGEAEAAGIGEGGEGSGGTGVGGEGGDGVAGVGPAVSADEEAAAVVAPAAADGVCRGECGLGAWVEEKCEEGVAGFGDVEGAVAGEAVAAVEGPLECGTATGIGQSEEGDEVAAAPG
jgi:hypothetical protein